MPLATTHTQKTKSKIINLCTTTELVLLTYMNIKQNSFCQQLSHMFLRDILHETHTHRHHTLVTHARVTSTNIIIIFRGCWQRCFAAKPIWVHTHLNSTVWHPPPCPSPFRPHSFVEYAHTHSLTLSECVCVACVSRNTCGCESFSASQTFNTWSHGAARACVLFDIQMCQLYKKQLQHSIHQRYAHVLAPLCPDSKIYSSKLSRRDEAGTAFGSGAQAMLAHSLACPVPHIYVCAQLNLDRDDYIAHVRPQTKDVCALCGVSCLQCAYTPGLFANMHTQRNTHGLHNRSKMY